MNFYHSFPFLHSTTIEPFPLFSCRYVPMFGETEYDPIKQFDSIDIEEQLDGLGRAVDAGKVSDDI